MIAICIPVMVGWRERSHGRDWGRRYRWYEILNVIKSMNECDTPERLELSVYSLGSIDHEQYWKMIFKHWHGAFAFGHESLEELEEKGVAGMKPGNCLNVSYGVNRAARQAKASKLFISYMDITIPHHFVELYDAIVNRDTVWFPVCYHIGRFDPWEVAKKPSEYRGWQNASKGLVGIMKSTWNQMGQYDEVHNWKWASDSEFLRRCELNPKINTVRNQTPGFFHIDHPGTAVRGSEFIKGRDWTKEGIDAGKREKEFIGR